MKLSVVIPTYNRRDVILKTLPTVLDQTFPAGEYEVVVVVDGSTDGTAEALRKVVSRVEVRVLEQENRGQAGARNAGINAARGGLVLFLDDDLFCERDLIARHVAAHVDDNLLVFGPVRVAPGSPENLATKWFREDARDWEDRLAREGVSWPVDAVCGPNSSVRREALIAAGGFDERFFRALEDWDLGQRLWQAGVRSSYCPSALTHQFFVKTTDDVVLKDYPLYGKNEVLLCRKHPEFLRTSFFAEFSSGGPVKAHAKEFLARLPFSVDPLLRLAEKCAGAGSGAGLRIFNARRRVSIYRSLMHESGGWAHFRKRYVRFIPVLMYHRIGPIQPGTFPTLTVEPGRLREQMGWLRRSGYTTIRSEDWLAWCTGGRPLPERPVMLTFDDAYQDLVEYAFPALEEHGFTATVFVVTGEVGGTNSWDKGKSAAMRCMDAEQIKKWSGRGIEFGAHSRTHADLTSLSGPGLEDEVAGSGRDLAELLGEFPLSFAYPYGYYDDTVASEAVKAFKLAFTCDEGLNVLGSKPSLLRRTMVQPNDTLLDFALRVRFGFSEWERLRARVRLGNRVKGALRADEGM